MLLGLFTKDVRINGEVEYAFTGDSLLISGKNGAGKSTICEAICYALTGRDSSGGPCPVHLIARGASGLLVHLTLNSGWEIRRSLTMKKNSTLSVSKNGGPEFKVTQQGLTEILGLADLAPEIYLAATIPGYFMRMPSSKRFSMLSMILPQINRAKHISERCGFSEEEVSIMCGGFSRGIPNWQNYSHYRIDLQKKQSKLEGRMEEISRNIGEEAVPPKEPLAMQLLPIAQDYADAVQRHVDEQAAFVRAKNQYNYILMENESRIARRRELETTLEGIELWIPTAGDLDTTLLESLKAQLRIPPEKPSVLDLPSSDCCPSCGQVVGSGLRAQVWAENESKMREYDALRVEVVTHNERINKLIDEEQMRLYNLAKSNEEIRNTARRNQEYAASIERELESLFPMNLPEMPTCSPKPQIPEILEQHGIGPYKKNLVALRAEIDNYLKDKGIYDRKVQDKLRGEELIESLKTEAWKIEEDISRYSKFEQALKSLPQEEVLEQRHLLLLENYTVDFSDGFDVRLEVGTPYECMSSGERMVLNISLCMKIQDLLPSKPGWCFVDDADLLQNIGEVKVANGVQMLYALVDNNYEKVIIRNY